MNSYKKDHKASTTNRKPLPDLNKYLAYLTEDDDKLPEKKHHYYESQAKENQYEEKYQDVVNYQAQNLLKKPKMHPLYPEKVEQLFDDKNQILENKIEELTVLIEKIKKDKHLLSLEN